MQDVAPPPAPPAPPTPDVAVIEGVQGINVDVGLLRDPAAVHRAAMAKRDVLREQLDELTDQREELQQALRSEDNAVSRAGLEARLGELDQRILVVERQLGSAEAQVAQTAGIPGAMVEEPPPPLQGPPEWAVAMGFVLILFIAFPLVIAYARRIWRRGGPAPAVLAMPPELSERMTRLEQAVDAIALEVERVTEGQRFMTKVITEGNRGLGSGEPVRAPGAGARP